MRPFAYHRATSAAEAVSLLATSDAAPLGGGTDLLVCIEERIMAPSILVDLRHIADADAISVLDNGDLRIGAGVRIDDIANNAEVRGQFPALAQACEVVGSPALRNMGTLGGNLCLDTRCHFINQTAFWRKAIGSCLKDVGDVCRVAPGSSRCWAIASADLPPPISSSSSSSSPS